MTVKEWEKIIHMIIIMEEGAEHGANEGRLLTT